ncbi:threonine ammonia-lyase IlvA [Metabacillus sp. 84]|uniref:threonine ammonia-lyase IlvA n=1 Tax=unclassified Metabacillus TaxID=2675274 RepID=UPI003CF1E6FF
MKPLTAPSKRSAVHVESILKAHHLLKDVVIHTPLQYNRQLSEHYQCNVYLKREDLQLVRSFKIRGAYNKIKSLSTEELVNGIVCASAGNHAQGVAYSCEALGIKGKIFMPSTTPRQKVNQVEKFAKGSAEIILCGDTFDDSYHEAVKCCKEEGRSFIHPFDDEEVIAGQGTVAVEILNDSDVPVDFVFASFGGGGLISGIGTYFQAVSPKTKIMAVEPEGAASFTQAKAAGEVVTLKEISKFIDGAAVKRVGEKTFDIASTCCHDTVLVPDGKVCSSILGLYNDNAIVAEPAGALPIAALDFCRDQIKGKNVVCVVSGGNNDIGRMQEIKEKSMIYEGLQHYFIVNFPQRAGALREFLHDVLGPNDDINRFEYTKKNNKENGPALVGIELKDKKDYPALISKMDVKGFQYTEVIKDEQLFNLLI